MPLSSSHSTEDLQKVVFFVSNQWSISKPETTLPVWQENTPFIIDKDSGEIFDLGTTWPLEKYLKDYEESKKARS
ncbi:Uncharacterised protein [Citrobacter koseri]|uniref:Uncharacterized protein n=1 Tax=Citrobacter koseri TaxID=545 RepID=A0A2X2WFR0_CITKO|nr:Uncharacterised protein [Citrobacter koseri]